MTLLVRDEEDIVEEQLRFHLEHGVDFVIATDHRSSDRTSEILRRYAHAGHVHLIQEDAVECPQGLWVTRMARLAATDFGADWVINSDADEFWFSREGQLREVLAAIPERFGAIRGIARHFVPRPEGAEPFYERMVVRRLPDSDPMSPYQPSVKVLHRADRDVVVPNGNHDALGRRLRLMREWCLFDVLHFPIRSRAQMERKFSAWHPDVARTRVGRHAEAAARAIQEGAADSLFTQYLVDDGALAKGLAQGLFTIDTRVREALRGLEVKADGGEQQPTAETTLLVQELDLFQATDAAVQLAQRVDAFCERLRAVEASSLFWPDQLFRRMLSGSRDT